MAKDWKLGTGSLLLDAAAFLSAVVRQASGKEWVVTFGAPSRSQIRT